MAFWACFCQGYFTQTSRFFLTNALQKTYFYLFKLLYKTCSNCNNSRKYKIFFLLNVCKNQTFNLYEIFGFAMAFWAFVRGVDVYTDLQIFFDKFFAKIKLFICTAFFCFSKAFGDGFCQGICAQTFISFFW